MRATCPCGRMFSTVDELLRHAKTCNGDRAPKHAPRTSKYNNQRTPHTSPYCGTRVYASKREAEYAWGLDALTADPYTPLAGWAPQPQLDLGGIAYRPDFVLFYFGAQEFVDVKGVETPGFRTVRKLWPKHAKFPLRIVKRGEPDEVIEPERKQ